MEVTSPRTGMKVWALKRSKKAEKTFNPIRRIVDYMNIQPNPELQVINLSLGM